MPVRLKHGQLKQEIGPILYSVPALALFIVFFAVPAFLSIYYSLFQWNGIDRVMQFVGLRNYYELMRDQRFWSSVRITLQVVVYSGLPQMVFALFIATLLVSRRPGMRILRNVMFIPQMLSIAAVGMIWLMAFNPYYGLINMLIESIGLEQTRIAWLGDTKIALLSMCFVTTWMYFGFHMILFLAAMSNLPHEVLEAAKLETNSGLMVFSYVTLPLLRETLLVSAVFIFTGTFGALIGLYWAMTQGGPIQSTELIGIYMYKQSFSWNRIGYASAIATVMVVLLGLVISIPIKVMTRDTIEY